MIPEENRTEVLIMNKTVKCLYLELPVEAANSVSDNWNKVKNFYEQALESKEKEIVELKGMNSTLYQMTNDFTAEIERLKGLIGYAHQHGFANSESHGTIEASWQQFKQINQL